MTLRVLWSERARRDLTAIGDFIARDKPEAAARWVGTIQDLVVRAAAFPHSGRVVPEFGREDLREMILRGYRVVYQLRRDTLIVVTVFEGHRRIPASLDKISG